MKKRIGFVSNSSSSSYIVFGNYRTLQNILLNDKDNNLYLLGDASDGYDLIHVTPEIKEIIYNNYEEFINKYGWISGIQIYHYFESDIHVNKLELINLINDINVEDIEIISLLVDYHSCKDEKDFINNYIK